jgi:hypothetical protein
MQIDLTSVAFSQGYPSCANGAVQTNAGYFCSQPSDAYQITPPTPAWFCKDSGDCLEFAREYIRSRVRTSSSSYERNTFSDCDGLSVLTGMSTSRCTILANIGSMKYIASKTILVHVSWDSTYLALEPEGEVMINGALYNRGSKVILGITDMVQIPGGTISGCHIAVLASESKMFSLSVATIVKELPKDCADTYVTSVVDVASQKESCGHYVTEEEGPVLAEIMQAGLKTSMSLVGRLTDLLSDTLGISLSSVSIIAGAIAIIYIFQRLMKCSAANKRYDITSDAYSLDSDSESKDEKQRKHKSTHNSNSHRKLSQTNSDQEDESTREEQLNAQNDTLLESQREKPPKTQSFKD